MWTRPLLCALLALAATAAWAQAGLTGTWNADLNGTPITLTLDGKGGGQVDGRPIRYQTMGQLLFIEDQGQVYQYQYQVNGNQMLVSGGVIQGILTMTRGHPGAAPAPAAGGLGGAAAGGYNQAQAHPQAQAQTQGGVRQELVGKWCKASNFSANGGGGSQSSACFELHPNGSYMYGAQRSMSAYGGGMYGGTSGGDSDAGRWTATDFTITAHSNSGRVSTYQLEKRNHPKNRDPMLCLDGDCYVTFYNRRPW